jgi:hypothetical protein
MQRRHWRDLIEMGTVINISRDIQRSGISLKTGRGMT